jgi:predicted DNA-binding protein YlxM (UPF0122 family)
MTIEQIKQLLEKYWAGDTSLEEEFALKTFFSGDSISDELKKYQPLFLWKTKQLQLKGSPALKAGLKKPVSIQWYSILKVAASVLLVLALGIGFYTHYQQEKTMDKIFSETYSDPEDALKETKIVIGKISSALNQAKDEQTESQNIDSLEQNPKDNMEE